MSLDAATEIILPHRDIDLTIGIVTWNNQADIAACLASLPAAAGNLDWSAIVLDNASTDGTVEVVERDFPGILVWQNTGNVGFGAAHNQIMRTGVGRRHMVLNPDTVAMPGSLEALSRFLDQNPQAAFVGPRILEKDGTVYPSCRAFPTAGALLFRNELLNRFFPKNPYTRDYLMGDRDHSASMPAGWLSGSAMMASRDALDAIGLFDDRFFMYCEDMDWCRRAHDANRGVYYEPAATIIHTRARSTDQRIPAMIMEHHRSMWKYFCKHERSRHPGWWSAGLAVVLTLRALVLVTRHFVTRFKHWRRENYRGEGRGIRGEG